VTSIAPAVDPAPDSIADFLAVQTKGLKKSFGANQILTGTNIEIPEGSISTVLGPSGTGKSVLVKHILGLLSPDEGEIFVHGRALHAMSRSEILALRREIGVMFQDGALFSSMNVYDNVAFPLRQHTDLNESEVHQLVQEQLDAVGLLAAAGSYPKELSGGMRKRAGLARALVMDPGIVLCDEPDSGLDPVRTALLGDLLLERQAELGGTMIVVTHNIALAKLISDHISVLWRGQIIASGSRDAIFGSDDPFVRQFLDGAVAGPLGMDA
jgi:phospholipid/cholesterol/gamma-HCH transport system ATP-binding protein